MTERKKRGIILGSTVCIFILAMGLPFAQADEYDITHCASATNTILYSSNELTILSLDAKGIVFSNHPNKNFDNATYQCGKGDVGSEAT